MEWLEKLGISDADIAEIRKYDRLHGERMHRLAQEYMAGVPRDYFVPYPEGTRPAANARRDEFLARARVGQETTYMADLLFWLHCVPMAQKRYEEFGIAPEIFWESMTDFSYKIQECKTRFGVCGVASMWYLLMFEWKLVALGRLRYQVVTFPEESYTWNDYRLERGDVVYACHIPTAGPLTQELCMDSLDRAYQFLKDKLKGGILPVTCNTWLLYPPYVEQVFPPNSNLRRFADLFDVVNRTEIDVFDDGWRVFGPAYFEEGKALPCDTTLRRNFLRYIENGGGFGRGYGVLLYDGERKCIYNR